jgi:hypothetical protein
MPILYVLGCNDPGVEELAEYFGRDGWRWRRQPNVTIRMLDGADHTLGTHKLRAALIGCIRDWCHGNWPMRDSVVQPSAAARTQGSHETAAGASVRGRMGAAALELVVPAERQPTMPGRR